MKKIKLYDYQQEMLEKIITKLTTNSFLPFRKRKEYAENYSVLVQMPTGTGKTYFDGFGGEVVSLFPIFSECNKRKGVNFFFCIIYFFILFFIYDFPVF